MLSSVSRSLVLALSIVLAVAGPAGAQTPGPAPDLLISEVYGGGGNVGATYRNDFVELFNRGSTPVTLDGRSLQYGSAAGNFGSSVTPLSGTIEPGQYFLVQLAAGSGGTTPLPTPDLTGSTAASATAGKVALAEGTSALGCGATGNLCATARILDLVGYRGGESVRGGGPGAGRDERHVGSAGRPGLPGHEQQRRRLHRLAPPASEQLVAA